MRFSVKFSGKFYPFFLKFRPLRGSISWFKKCFISFWNGQSEDLVLHLHSGANRKVDPWEEARWVRHERFIEWKLSKKEAFRQISTYLFSRSIASLARSLRLSLIPWRSATSPNCSNTEFIAGRGPGNGREISPRKGSRTKDQRMKSIGFWFTEKVSTKRSATIRIDYFSLQKVG